MWLIDLKACVEERRMAEALSIFRENQGDIQTWSWGDFYYEFPILVDCSARLLDRDTKHLPLVEEQIREFSTEAPTGKLPLISFTRIELAKGVVLFHRHKFLKAIEQFSFGKRLADECGHNDLQAMTRYYLSRSQYRVGRFAEALAATLEAEEVISSDGPALGLIKRVEAWIRFNEQSVEEAEKVLLKARELLWGTDYVEEGNILAMEGRFARQKGLFETAVEKVKKAIERFEDNDDVTHPNFARCHVHLAFGLLLRAQKERLKIEKGEADLYRTEAFESLRTAEVICREGGHERVLNRVHYFRARWLLAMKEFKKAAREAQEAYRISTDVSDPAIRAHAKITECECMREKNAPYDARELAEKAFKEVEGTDNRRAKARVLIWMGITESDHPIRNYSEAQKYYKEAHTKIRPSDQDYLLWELNKLKRQIDEQSVEDLIILERLTVDQVLAGLGTSKLDRSVDEIQQKSSRLSSKRSIRFREQREFWVQQTEG